MSSEQIQYLSHEQFVLELDVLFFGGAEEQKVDQLIDEVYGHLPEDALL